MIPNELLAEELLQQAATELAMALNNSLPQPDKCQHKFSNEFEEKMQSLHLKCPTLSRQFFDKVIVRC